MVFRLPKTVCTGDSPPFSTPPSFFFFASQPLRRTTLIALMSGTFFLNYLASYDPFSTCNSLFGTQPLPFPGVAHL